MALFASGLVRAKIGALFLHPDGVGLFGQANTAIALAVTICTLCISVGLSQKIAEAKESQRHDLISSYLSSAVWGTLTLSAGAAVACILSRAFLAREVFGDSSERVLVSLSSLTLVPSALSSIIAGPIFFGTGTYGRYSAARTVSTLLGALFYIVGTVTWGLRGALVSVALAGISDLVAILVAAAPVMRSFGIRLTNFKPAAWRDLISFGLANLVVSFVRHYVSVFVRGRILEGLGTESAGFYHVATAVGGYWTVFFTSGIWASFHPSVSGKSREVQTALLNQGLLALGLPAAATAALVIAARSLVVRLLYTPAFDPCQGMIAAQALADVAALLNVMLAAFYLAQDRKLAFIVWHTVPFAAMAGGVAALAGSGPLAVPVAFAIGGGSAFFAQCWMEGVARRSVIILLLLFLGLLGLWKAVSVIGF